MANEFNKHIETSYLNKPFFIQLKRVWRFVKKIPNQERPKKIGFFLQEVRKLAGNQKTNEKIIRDIFGKSQQMTPKDFIEKLFEYEVPEGKKVYLKPETSYQTTQRLLPNEELNKTISASIFGDIYDDIIKEYEKKSEGDEVIRNLNRNLSTHFTNASSFVRWTNIKPWWIHIDAFQADFFSHLKKIKFQDPNAASVVDKLRKHENEFFKTAFSFIVRNNPKLKMVTANTEEMVKRIENVRGEVKLKEYYVKLPKILGFKLISMDKLKKILRTRPGEKTENLINKFFKAIKSYGEKSKKISMTGIKEINETIIDHIVGSKPLTPEAIDRTINDNFPYLAVRSAYHQYIEELSKITGNKEIEKKEKRNIEDIKKKVKDFLNKKSQEIYNTVNKEAGIFKNIWWMPRGLAFEHNKLKVKNLLREVLWLQQELN